MGQSPARRSSATNDGAIRSPLHGADTLPARPGQQDEEHERRWLLTILGARSDDIASPRPADASPPNADDKETAAIKAFALVADRWKLSDRQAASLLGTDVDAWQTLRARIRQPDEHTTLERHSLSLPGDLTDPSSEHSSLPEESKLRHAMYSRAVPPPRQTTLSEDQLARISTFFYMYISLQRLCNQGSADRWVTCENYSPVFEGRTPLAVMIEGGLPKIREARDYISSALW